MLLPRELIARCVRNFPGKPAYVCGDATRTWREMDQRSDRLAAALRGLGIGSNATVAILGRESLVVYEHFFACMKMGLVRLGLNWRYSADELAHLLADSGAAAVLVDAHCTGLLEPHRESLEARGVVLVGYGHCHGFAHDYESLLAQAVELDALPAVSPDDTLMLTYTSGSTGHPKGVLHRQEAISRMIVQSLITRGLSPDDVWYTAASSSWMTVVLNLLGLGNGMSHVITDGVFDMRSFLADIQKHRATAIMLVPTLIQRALQELQLGRYDLGSLRLLMYGSAPATPQLIREAYDAFGCEMIQSYGMTEAGWVTQLGAADHRYAIEHEPALLRSAGRPGVFSEIAIRGANGEALAAGECGDVWIKTETLMQGYLNQPAETSETLHGGWFLSNDLGYLDERGYLYLTDRRKFMIISGAVNIFPSKIEAALCEHPSVEEVAVVGAAHPEWGEAVVAVVKLRAHISSASGQELALHHHCTARLNPMERPKHYLFVDGLPRNVNGKVRKQEIRDWVAAQAGKMPW